MDPSTHAPPRDVASVHRRRDTVEPEPARERPPEPTLQDRLVAVIPGRFALDTDPLAPASAVPSRLWDAALRDLLRDFLARPGKGVRAQLTEAGWAFTGQPAAAMPSELPLLVELLHAGSLLIDDVQDAAETRRGAPAAHQLFGTPAAINAGGWLYFFPFALLTQMGLSPSVRLALSERISATVLQCHQGQALDLATRVHDLAPDEVAGVVEAVSRFKTGALLRLSVAIGAVAGGAASATVAALERFGERVGLALQMYDDLSGFVRDDLAHKAAEDLAEARPTWVWAWLAETLPPERYRALTRQLAAPAAHPALRERLAAHVAEPGVACARRTLDEACVQLLAAVGPSSATTALCARARTLEAAYVRP